MGSGGLGDWGGGVGGGFLTGRSPRFLVDGFLCSVILSSFKRNRESWRPDVEHWNGSLSSIAYHL